MVVGIDWNEVQAISTTVLVLTSAGAIGYAALQLRQEREYRTISNLEKQLAVFYGDSFTAARQQLAADRLVQVEDTVWRLVIWDWETMPISALAVLDFYDHLGLLVKKGHLELYNVWHAFYEFAQPVYVDLRRLIEDEASAYADHYGDFRWLMRMMDDIQLERMHKKNANHWALWTPERIIEHYKYELESANQSRTRTRKRLMVSAV